MVPEHQSGYQRLITRSGGVNNYIYSPAYRGTKIMYRAYRENSIGNSDAVYDFIYPPYRNADASSPVYVKQIKFTDWSLERWPAGKPEFYLKVVGAADDGKHMKYRTRSSSISILNRIYLRCLRIKGSGLAVFFRPGLVFDDYVLP